jgi:hypothetical protein
MPGNTADKHGMSPEDWAALDALTPEEVHAQALADPDAQPRSDEWPARAAYHWQRSSDIDWR